MTVRRVLAGALLTWALPLVTEAQDVEILGAMHGRAVPRGYYERLRTNPAFFTWPDVWAPRPAAFDRWTTLSQVLAANTMPPRTGTLPILVIPALFADTRAPHISQEQLQATLFDGPSAYGTIAEVYSEISRGNLRLRGQVMPWHRSPLTLAEVNGTSNGLGSDSKLGDYMRAALQRADSLLDFGQFDNNGADGIPNSGDDNGVVDAIAFLYLERSAPCGGPGVWPHLSGYAAWTGSPFVSNDRRPNGQPITANGYVILSATECTTDDIMPPAILAHELGHVLGLPDLYDARAGIGPAFRRWVVGCWDLMGAGAWGCGDGSATPTARRPSHYGAWSKDQMGWTNPVIVGTVRNQEFTLRPAHLSNDVLRVQITPSEWYDIEFRVRDGYDRELAQSGLAIFHVDSRLPVLPCGNCTPAYRVQLVEADGNGALLQISNQGGNRGEAGDVWGPSGRTKFSGATLPAARRRDGQAFPFAIHDITIDEAAGVARIRLTTDPAVAVAVAPGAPWPALIEEVRRIPVTGGALPYTLTPTGTLPEGITLSVDADAIVLRGAPLRSGTFPISVAVRDALAVTTTASLSLSVTEPQLPLATLLQRFVLTTTPPLAPLQERYLDVQGNNNQRYDVGDLRAYLRTHPNVQ